MKDEPNHSYNGGGVVYLLQSEISISTRQQHNIDRWTRIGQKIKIKKKTANNTAAQNLGLQQERHEDFQKLQDSMYSLLSYPYEVSMFIKLVNLSSNTIKDNFSHLRVNIGGVPNQRRETSFREIIWRLKSGPEQGPPPE